MPSVNVAMERSLRGGFLDLLAASLRPAFERRDVITDAQGKANDVKTAFSSWDNCMNAVYCKWPVIAIIIVGGLFLFSIVYCVSRCLCCGLSCCCECCQCLKCCGNCCGCCDPPGGKKHKYLDEPFVPPHHAAYKSHEPMVAGSTSPFHSDPTPAFASGPTPTASPFARAAAVPEPPQYAVFEDSKRATASGHEDALPVMPTWESAGSKKVLVEEEEVEMDHLKKPEANAANGQNVPLMTGQNALPGPVSPIPSPNNRSPFIPPGAPGAGGYMGASATDPYTASGRGYNNYNSPGQYGQSQTSLGTDQGYGMAGAAMAGAGRRSPRDYNNNNNNNQNNQNNNPNNNGYGKVGQQDPYSQGPYGQQDQGYPAARPAAPGYNNNSYNSQPARQPSYDDYNTPPPPTNQGYARSQARGPMPAAGTYPQERMGRTPPPRAADYGHGGARTYSPAPMMPQPQRQPTYEMPDPAAGANNQGGAGYGRAQQQGQEYGRGTPGQDGYGGSRPQRTQQQGGGGYQGAGYRGNGQGGQGGQQQQQGWSGI